MRKKYKKRVQDNVSPLLLLPAGYSSSETLHVFQGLLSAVSRSCFFEDRVGLYQTDSQSVRGVAVGVPGSKRESICCGFYLILMEDFWGWTGSGCVFVCVSEWVRARERRRERPGSFISHDAVPDYTAHYGEGWLDVQAWWLPLGCQKTEISWILCHEFASRYFFLLKVTFRIWFERAWE